MLEIPTAKYTRLSVSNNGDIFSEGDWDRLKRIAEGNPDEEKIGAFGVGFYSVFSTCDEPMVTSGKHVMGVLLETTSVIC